MARAIAPNRVLPSLFDRLTREGGVIAAPGITREQAVRRLRNDLVGLLNTRRVLAEVPEGLEALSESILTHGLADFTSIDLGIANDRERLRIDIESTLRRCEPRLIQVSVTIDDPGDAPLTFALGFRIEALFQVSPETIPLRIVTELQKDTRTFVVHETWDALPDGDS